MVKVCPECGASWQDGITCQEFFHQMLFWEGEDPANGRVHHLLVLCYHLQHPSLYSQQGLEYAQSLLVDFLENRLSPGEVRIQARDKVDSGKRAWKIKAGPGSVGSYQRPVRWTMTAADVVGGGIERYCENVEAWAIAVLETLKELQ